MNRLPVLYFITTMVTPIAIEPAPWTLFRRTDDSAPSNPKPLSIDTRFRVLRALGRGGMGSVFLCEDRALRSQAAVKVLRTSDPDARQRFLEEATILANVRHPHLVQVLAVGETDDGAPYMAMEHLGESLARRLRKGGAVPWQEVVEIAGQIASALSALHRAGVVHRDVKPDNIAELRGITGRTFVKLIDLGIARVDDLAELQSGGDPLPVRRPTEAGRALGTPGYLAPEAGLASPDPRFDVYSLGVTIFQLCTGVMPDPLDPRSMRESRPELGIPKALDDLVGRAMAILPEDRIGSAAQLRRELAELDRVHHAADLFDDCYELLEVLGIGAKAEVYRAYHRDARRYVALKILRDGAADDLEERRRFDREARVLASVTHPVIPALVDCRTSELRRRPFIAMELRTGTRAADLDPELLSLAETIEVGQQLASGLATIHAAGIVHRDLNRTNVLIERFEDGRRPRVSIIDFGQAELSDVFYAQADERYPTRPELRAALGSGGLENAEWTAPEARARRGWTAASDVYSLGRLLYLLVTGKRPIEERPGVWRSPAVLVPDCDGPLAEAILGALQVDPNQRLDAAVVGEYLGYAAAELRDVDPAPAPAAVASSPREASSRSPRRTLPRLAGLAALCAVIGLAGWALGRGQRNPEPSDQTTPALATQPATPLDQTSQASPRDTPPPAADPAPPSNVERPELREPEQVETEPTTPRRRLPSMRAALRRVEDDLRACSRLADGLLLVEFSTDGSERFAAVTAVAETDPVLLECVRRATAKIRFSPTPRRKFTEEYRP